MMLKVCGMRSKENIEELLEVEPEFMGLIFYPKSKRFVRELDAEVIDRLERSETKVVGVFVNASLEVIEQKVEEYKLDFVQLHGDEPLELGQQLAEKGMRVIKVFGVKDELPQEEISLWEPLVDYFLFDTKSTGYGGTGQRFSWNILKDYQARKPFFLSGGIALENANEVLEMDIPELVGVDVNSKLEIAPAIKDMEKVRDLKKLIC